MNKLEELKKYRDALRDKDARQTIAWAYETFGPENIVLATSLGAEDQVLTEMAASANPAARIVTLDTGRLFQETYNVIQETNQKYGIHIQMVFPDAGAVEELVRLEGPNLFYASVENRKRCCGVRKVQPLQIALRGAQAWICGLRREQSAERQTLERIEWDEEHGLYKICPLFDWSEATVWDYIKSRSIPYNSLHDRGFRSIGCAPCTRAVKSGEDPRSGRWWWEKSSQKECGLHPPSR